MPEEIEALISLKLIQQFTNELPKLVVSALKCLAQERLQFGKNLLDRVQVRTVRRQSFLEGFARHGLIQAPRDREPVGAQAGNEGQRLPVAGGCRIPATRAA
jgi:hypothetical protein